MELVRRHFLQVAGAAFTTSTASSVALAQAPSTAPRLTQVLRKDMQGQDQLVQESVISVVEFGPGAAAPWHMHPGAQEIFYVQEGSLTIEVEGQGPMAIMAGEASIIPANIPHLARNESASIIAKALVVHSRSAKDKPLVVPVKKAT